MTFDHEGESIYCLPWGDGHYFGYKPTPIQNGLDNLTAPDADIEQLVTQARELFPRLDITRKSLLGSWAGCLPATFDEQSPDGVFELGLHDMSRDGLPNMLAITAGNIMTHRQTALAVRHEIERVVPPSGRGTGSISYSGEPHEQTFNRQQMVDAARNEHVVNLDDLLFRRTGVAWLPSFGRDVARDAADVIAPEMGWDQKDIEAQLSGFGAALERLRG